MDEFYELLDQKSGTLLKEYETEQAALRDLRAFSHEHGRDSLRGLALLRVVNDDSTLVAMDVDLIEHVKRSELVQRITPWTTSASPSAYELRVQNIVIGRSVLKFHMPQGFTATEQRETVCAS